MKQLTLFDTDETTYKSDFYTTIQKGLGVSFTENWIEEFRNKLRENQSSAPEKIKVLSLFSGGGGLDIGFDDLGFEIIEAVEIDKNCAITLKENISNGNLNPNCIINSIDIREYNPVHLKGLINFIIGGPPCQTFSAAGRRASGVLGTSDERGTLFEEYVRILKLLEPEGFLFENVSGILGAEKGESWRLIQEAFAEVGYKLHYRVLDSADYGVPQFRERLIIIGTKNKSYLFPRPTHGPDSIGKLKYFSAHEAIQNVISDEEELSRRVTGRYGHLLDDIPPGLNYSYFTEKMGHPNPIFAWRSKFSDFLYKADPDMPVRTLKAQGGQYTGPFHWKNRPFTIAELKRLQTFPDNYKFNTGRSPSIKQIGNSVPPQLARILALSVAEQLFNIKLPIYIDTLQENEQLGFKSRKSARTKMYMNRAAEYIKKYKEQNGTEKKKDFIPDRYYSAMINTNNFTFSEYNSEKVNVEYGEKVNVQVKNSTSTLDIYVYKNELTSDFTIELKPLGQGWDIKYETIRLMGENLDSIHFISVWKALDYELQINNVKADLVQLHGYYQYKSSFYCQMFHSNVNISKEWDIVSKVLSDTEQAELKSEIQLAEEWITPKSTILHYANFLRKLGFEVRNTNTNPQIPRNHFLIPYKFPTLTPLSVQLQKKLGGISNEEK
ncbi:TPA: DNA cytosine methyltransferase [Bacillus cereus]|uniref:DNA cytosine methyltransferase n=1 Tax=Bacillus cereus TaxID=1396 RepID=UPI001F2BF774|nr:DNA (cytosine-5-)-methyltransferase [Bacillus cereus]BCC10487.1 hypothetical protein BCM0074_0870 [Bacillus cereus]HDR6305248.1 DNA (cytosine-5-)-methyltransferase [Bacillus cereus]